MSRKSRKIKPNKTYQVICCGYTEYHYLDIYKRNNRLHYSIKINVKAVRPDQQVAYANKICKNIDKCFVLFDYDSFFKSTGEVKQLIEKFETKDKFKIVFSNECFDLWILAHFERITKSYIDRQSISRKLDRIFGQNYESLKADTSMLRKLTEQIDDAIKNITPIANDRFENPTFDLKNFREIISK